MRRAGFIASAAAGTDLLASALSSSRGADGARCVPRSLVPAYLYPRRSTARGARDAAATARGQPGERPGAAPDRAYRRAIAAARAGGARVLGYVPTTWAAPAADAVEADIDRYREWYGVNGVFLDEAAASESALALLPRTLHATAREFVVLNPGSCPRAATSTSPTSSSRSKARSPRTATRAR